MASAHKHFGFGSNFPEMAAALEPFNTCFTITFVVTVLLCFSSVNL